MKKLVAILLAGVLILGMSITAFAGSIGDMGDVITDEKLGSVDGSIVASQIEITNKFVYSVQAVKGQAKLLGISDADSYAMVESFDIHMSSEAGNTAILSDPVKVTFKVEKATKDSEVAVLHYREDTAEWEKLESTAGDGTVTATFAHGFSPVAILLKDAEALEEESESIAEEESKAEESKAAEESKTSDGKKADDAKTVGESKPADDLIAPAQTDNKDANKNDASGSSPKTGEFPFVSVFACVAILAGAGLTISFKKRNENQ